VDWAAELVGVAFEPDVAPTSIAGAEFTSPENKRAMTQEEMVILDRSPVCKSFSSKSTRSPFYALGWRGNGF